MCKKYNLFLNICGNLGVNSLLIQEFHIKRVNANNKQEEKLKCAYLIVVPKKVASTGFLLNVLMNKLKANIATIICIVDYQLLMLHATSIKHKVPIY